MKMGFFLIERRMLKRNGLLLLYLGVAEVRVSGVIFCLVGQIHTTWEVLYLQINRVRAYNPATGCINDMLLQPCLLLGNEAFGTT